MVLPIECARLYTTLMLKSKKLIDLKIEILVPYVDFIVYKYKIRELPLILCMIRVKSETLYGIVIIRLIYGENMREALQRAANYLNVDLNRGGYRLQTYIDFH